MFEITKQPKCQDDDKLMPTGLAVLQMSKLLLLKFVYFLEEHLIEGSYKLLYLGMFIVIFAMNIKQFLDTDSIFLGLTKTAVFPEDFESDFHGTWRAAFENIVKSDKMSSWQANSPDWFVLDQRVEMKRKPGEIIKKD